MQNLFPQGKSNRSISLNSDYLVLFKDPRDKLQILTPGKQMYPSETRCSVYQKVRRGGAKTIWIANVNDSRQMQIANKCFIRRRNFHGTPLEALLGEVFMSPVLISNLYMSQFRKGRMPLLEFHAVTLMSITVAISENSGRF